MQLRVASERRAGRPTSEDAGRLNEEILRVAHAVFAREGFGGATIEQIAQESRTTRRSVLSRFRDKEALLIAVIEMGPYRLQRGTTPSASMLAAKPVDMLKEMCSVMLESIVEEENIDFYRLCLAHVRKFPAISTAGLRWNDRLISDLELLVERCQRTGSFVGRNPAALATMLIGAFISNPVNRAALGDPQFPDPTLRRRYFDDLWNSVLDLA